MNGKLTAVQWLQDKLFELEIKIDYKAHQETFFIFEQAKQMEKEQIRDARESYINQMLKVNDDLLIYGESKFKEITSEEYYNETYGK
jgi:hypothetical protein